MLRSVSIAFLMLLLGSIAVPANDNQTTFPLAAKRVVFLGDSITNAGHYIADIETQLRAQGFGSIPELINLGLSSETCSGLSEPDHPFPRPDVHERLDRVLEKSKPDVVVACYGMNDGIYHPFSEERFAIYKAGIRKLVEKTHAAGAKIVLVTPPPFDPLPLRKKPGKLVPAGADNYAWFAVYENYDQVITRYAQWILAQPQLADMVIDVHTPLKSFLENQRRTDPQFRVAHDGVHMNTTGHEVMAKAILRAWGIAQWHDISSNVHDAVEKKTSVLHDAWLSHVGHKRPSVKPGLPLGKAQQQAEKLQETIDGLLAAEAAAGED